MSAAFIIGYPLNTECPNTATKFNYSSIVLNMKKKIIEENVGNRKVYNLKVFLTTQDVSYF